MLEISLTLLDCLGSCSVPFTRENCFIGHGSHLYVSLNDLSVLTGEEGVGRNGALEELDR